MSNILDWFKVGCLFLGCIVGIVGLSFGSPAMAIGGFVAGTLAAGGIHYFQAQSGRLVGKDLRDFQRRQYFAITPFSVRVDFDITVPETWLHENFDFRGSLLEGRFQKEFYFALFAYRPQAGEKPSSRADQYHHVEFQDWAVKDSPALKNGYRVTGTSHAIDPTHLDANVSSIIDLLEMTFSFYVWALPDLGANPKVHKIELTFGPDRRLHFDALHMETVDDFPLEGVQSILGKPRETFDGSFLLPNERQKK